MVAAVLLSMRLLAEEKQTGTIALYTSPISERQLIYGKFLSSLLVFIILQILTIYLPALIFYRRKSVPRSYGSGLFGSDFIGSWRLIDFIIRKRDHA